MLYCNRCGQSKYISEDSFVEIARVSGTEVRYLDCENGECIDYGDTDVSSDGDSDYECPNCQSGDIEWEWEGTEEQSFAQRAEWREEIDARDREYKKEILKEKIKDSDWDLVDNEVHV